jgi:hypothetical protein
MVRAEKWTLARGVEGKMDCRAGQAKKYLKGHKSPSRRGPHFDSSRGWKRRGGQLATERGDSMRISAVMTLLKVEIQRHAVNYMYAITASLGTRPRVWTVPCCAANARGKGDEQ